MPKRSVLFLAAVFGASATIAAPAHATYPGTNGLVYYSVNARDAKAKRAYQSDLFSVDPAAPGSRKRVRRTRSSETQPAASPGGSMLAYALDDAGKKNGIAVRDQATGKVTPLVSVEQPLGITWSPTGASLIFAANGLGIYSSPVDGGKVRRLVRATRTTEVWSPSVSPDGRQFVYQQTTFTKKGKPVSADFWSAALDGSGAHRIIGGAPGELLIPSEPDISPDGTRIVFVSETSFTEKNLQSGLFITNLDGSGRASSGQCSSQPGLQPPGVVAAGRHHRGRAVRPLPRAKQAQLLRVDPTTGASSVLVTHPHGLVMSPTWSAAPVAGGLVP